MTSLLKIRTNWSLGEILKNNSECLEPPKRDWSSQIRRFIRFFLPFFFWNMKRELSWHHGRRKEASDEDLDVRLRLLLIMDGMIPTKPLKHFSSREILCALVPATSFIAGSPAKTVLKVDSFFLLLWPRSRQDCPGQPERQTSKWRTSAGVGIHGRN